MELHGVYQMLNGAAFAVVQHCCGMLDVGRTSQHPFGWIVVVGRIACTRKFCQTAYAHIALASHQHLAAAGAGGREQCIGYCL